MSLHDPNLFNKLYGKRYSHTYEISFDVLSDDDAASDITPQEVRAAILHRLFTLTDNDIISVISKFDTVDLDSVTCAVSADLI